MAKVPVAGDVKTRLCPPLTPAAAATLAQCFLLDRLEQLSGLEAAEILVAFAPPEREAELAALLPATVARVPQHGPDLGSRMDRLLTDLLGAGYPGAVAIGTDTPTLPTACLHAACTALRDGTADVVLGPAEDGGYYLIGLRQPVPDLFRDMPWSTAAVLAETVARAGRLGLAVRMLPTWFDVDRPGDLARLRAAARGAAGDPYRPRRTLAFLAGITPPRG
jgi:rSAM/selenodomain-associated transferase 1